MPRPSGIGWACDGTHGGAPAEQSARDKVAALDGTLLETGSTRNSRVDRDVLDWMSGTEAVAIASVVPCAACVRRAPGRRNSKGMFIRRKCDFVTRRYRSGLGRAPRCELSRLASSAFQRATRSGDPSRQFSTPPAVWSQGVKYVAIIHSSSWGTPGKTQMCFGWFCQVTPPSVHVPLRRSAWSVRPTRRARPCSTQQQREQAVETGKEPELREAHADVAEREPAHRHTRCADRHDLACVLAVEHRRDLLAGVAVRHPVDLAGGAGPVAELGLRAGRDRDACGFGG